MAVRLASLTAVLAVSAFALAGGAGSHTGAIPTIHVVYAMDCTFAITDDAGNRVTSIVPGSYQVEITTPVAFATVDLSDSSDFTACKGSVQFQLTGPGLALSTTLGEGASTRALLDATFAANTTYTLQDNRQPSIARAMLTTVTSSGAPTPISCYCGGPPRGRGTLVMDLVGSKSPIRSTLDVRLGATGAPSLTLKGRPVRTLEPGRYKFVIDDGSPNRGFVIARVDRKPKSLSGARFVGRSTRGVTLTAGRWLFSSGSGPVRYFLVTA